MLLSQMLNPKECEEAQFNAFHSNKPSKGICACCRVKCHGMLKIKEWTSIINRKGRRGCWNSTELQTHSFPQEWNCVIIVVFVPCNKDVFHGELTLPQYFIHNISGKELTSLSECLLSKCWSRNRSS